MLADIGSKQLDKNMSGYVYKRRSDGIHIIDIRKLHEKIILAARIIAAIGACDSNE